MAPDATKVERRRVCLQRFTPAASDAVDETRGSLPTPLAGLIFPAVVVQRDAPENMTTPKTRWLFGLLLVMATAIGASEPLDALLWDARPLVLFADRPDAPAVMTLKHRIEKHADAFKDRRMALVEVYGDAGRIGDLPLTEEQAVALRKRFMPPEGEPTMVLLGLDGGEKIRAAADAPLSDLFTLIDRMPMRREELRNVGP
jgi:hypothetical protein